MEFCWHHIWMARSYLRDFHLGSKHFILFLFESGLRLLESGLKLLFLNL